MSQMLDKIESIYSTMTKPKPVPVVKPTQNLTFKSLYEREKQRADSMEKLILSQKTDLARYDKLADWMIENAKKLSTDATEVETPLVDVPVTLVDSIVLDFTSDGKESSRKYFAHNQHSGVYAYFDTIPDSMTKHNLAMKYKSYFVGVEDARVAFRVIRNYTTGKPELTSNGKRQFWVCAKSVWTKCSCIENDQAKQVRKTESDAKILANDSAAADALTKLKSMYGSSVANALVETTDVAIHPKSYNSWDATRGSELLYKVAKRTAGKLARDGEPHANLMQYPNPYQNMIDHGLEFGYTLEDLSQIQA